MPKKIERKKHCTCVDDEDMMKKLRIFLKSVRQSPILPLTMQSQIDKGRGGNSHNWDLEEGGRGSGEGKGRRGGGGLSFLF